MDNGSHTTDSKSEKRLLIDAEEFRRRIEKSIKATREVMLISTGPERLVTLGTALGFLISLRMAEMIDEAELDRRRAELTEECQGGKATRH